MRSGIRFDYLIYDKDDKFFRQLVTHHVSGQLKVAPEHCSNSALMMMGKPSIEVFEKFKKKYFELSREAGLEQYLVPYLMSSHPGATMKDAVEMALWLKKWGYQPEQVQDFYPTPGTISTVMYYTGIHPMTGKAVNVTTDYREKLLQRALLQYSKPENANLVREALALAGREDLIGSHEGALVREAFGQRRGGEARKENAPHRTTRGTSRQKTKKAPKNPYSRPVPIKQKKSKFDRIFGEDAGRIMRDAEKMSKNTVTAKKSTKSAPKKAKNSRNTKKLAKK